MTATATIALVPIQPAFSDAERLAFAGFLAGYRALTGGLRPGPAPVHYLVPGPLPEPVLRPACRH